MISTISKTDYHKRNFTNSQAKAPTVSNNSTTRPAMNLSGHNNPMKSYISFGWCTAHYQAMYEIDEKFSQRIDEKLKEIESINNREQNKAERYSLLDEASKLAAKIVVQYTNLQSVSAEVPPSYAVMTGGKLKAAMNKSKTFTNPVTLLVAINNINKMNVKNDKLSDSKLERGKGATQLYSIALLLKQIEENKDKPEFEQTGEQINSLVGLVKNSLGEIYGKDILERIDKFGNMGKTPSDEQKRDALNFLIEVDSKAKDLNLPNEFEEKLQELLDKQSEIEGKTNAKTSIEKDNLTIKINYPDHDHTVGEHHHDHDEHHHDHDYMHQHNIPHDHHEHHDKQPSEYEDALKDSQKNQNKTVEPQKTNVEKDKTKHDNE